MRAGQICQKQQEPRVREAQPLAYPAAVEDKLAILRRVPLFADLDERSLQAVAILAHEASFKAGEVLMVEGEAGDVFYVIVDGTVRIEAGDRTIRSMTSGGFLGEIALVDRRPRTATATVATDAHLLEIRAHEFDRLLDTLPAVHERIRSAVTRRIRTTDRGMSSQGTNDGGTT
jgi:CRP/FNR family cyclic AMP-dependent transcriptional regulator